MTMSGVISKEETGHKLRVLELRKNHRFLKRLSQSLLQTQGASVTPQAENGSSLTAPEVARPCGQSI
jgi:hypothetical protein